MQTMSLSRLLMIVSIAIAVLPVWRSPMISSRWPRPTGIIPSIEISPVWTGSVTGWRSTTPGALNSAGRVCVVATSPLSSSGRPSGSTRRPSSSSPTGIRNRWPVRFTVSPSTTLSHAPKRTAPTLSSSRLRARPVTPCGSSSISSAMQLSRPWMRAMPSATESTVPTSERSALPVSSPSILSRRIDAISSGLISMRVLYASLRRLGDALSKFVQATADARVEHHVAHLQDDAAEDLLVDPTGQIDLLADLPDHSRIELGRAGHGDVDLPPLPLPDHIELAADAEQLRHPPLLDQQLEEVDQLGLGAVERPAQPLDLLGRGEVRAEEEDLQLAPGVERRGELAQPLADRVELALRLGHVEEGFGVYASRVLHALALRFREAGEVDLAQRLLDQAALVVGGQRLAGDLLGRQHGQVGDLLADLLQRAPRLGLDVALRGRDQLVAFLLAGRGRLGFRGLRRLAGARHDVVGLLAGLGEAAAVLLEQLVGFVALPFGGLDRLGDRLRPAVERLLDPREGDLAQHPHREEEDGQRPDHQAEARRDQEAAAFFRSVRRLSGEGDEAHYVDSDRVHSIGLEEEGDQAEDEGVEGDRLGQREAEPADALQLVFHLRLAGDRLDLLAEDEADADAGADRAEPGAGIGVGFIFGKEIES